MLKWNILAVDDEPDVLSLIGKLLNDKSCQVETAANARIAWNMLRQPREIFRYRPFHART
jgi:CheY-like chemotaxis protein